MLRYFDTGFSHYEILFPVLHDGVVLCLSVHCNLRLLAGGTPLWVALNLGYLVAVMPACLYGAPCGALLLGAKGGGCAANLISSSSLAPLAFWVPCAV